MLGPHKPEGGGRDPELYLGSELNSEVRAAGPELREWTRGQLGDPEGAFHSNDIRSSEINAARFRHMNRSEQEEGAEGGSNQNATRSSCFLTCPREEHKACERREVSVRTGCNRTKSEKPGPDDACNPALTH